MPTTRKPGSGMITIPIFCIGIALIACCILIPQSEVNRKLGYERLSLQRDLAQLQHQASVNESFLKRVADDPTLSQRLAERQMKLVPEGTNILDLSGDNQNPSSPFLLVQVPAPAKLAPYRPDTSSAMSIFLETRSRLYLLGAGLFLVAAGLVLGLD